MRHYHRSDANQAELLQQASRIPGLEARVVSHVVEEFDVIWGYRGVTYLTEVKHPDRQTLRESQVRFINRWPGQIEVVTDLAGIMRMIGLGENKC